jgi:Protein of unknown function (DUF3016)
MNTRWTYVLSAALMACAASLPARAAGIVEVNFVKPNEYADIGRSAVDREEVLARFNNHLKAFGQRLPDGQTLKVQVLDIDLAGEVKPTFRAHDIRVLRGNVDWPRVKLHWDLVGGDGRVLNSGDEHLADMAYLIRTPRHASRDWLAYDLRLLDEWFVKRFDAAAAN